jgi:hypothetical protein
MTRLAAGPEFDPRVADWLEGDPDRAPGQVLETVLAALPSIEQRPASRPPWRTTQMSRFALGAAAVVGVMLISGALLLLKPTTGTIGGPSPAPSTLATPAPSVVPPLGALDRTFTSTSHGYTVKYPTGWTVVPSDSPWIPGTRTFWGDPALDILTGYGVRFVASSQPVAEGDTPELWLTGYCVLQGVNGAGCSDYPTKWTPISIGGQPGFVTLDGVTAGPGTMKPGGTIYDAVVVANGRGYEFTLDGDTDRQSFDRLMASVTFTPASSRIEHLTRSFTSPLYGYTILVDPTWTAVPSTTARPDILSRDDHQDGIDVAGTDTAIGASSAPLGNRTWDQLLRALRDAKIGDVPQGCEGGDPSTWPTIPVGPLQGRLQQLCNAALVYVLHGETVYAFEWGNQTFDATQHLDEADFFVVLKGASFPDSPSGSPGPSTH